MIAPLKDARADIEYASRIVREIFDDGVMIVVSPAGETIPMLRDARRHLLDAIENILAFELEIRASGARPTGSKPDEAPPNCAAGSVGRDEVGGAP